MSYDNRPQRHQSGSYQRNQPQLDTSFLNSGFFVDDKKEIIRSDLLEKHAFELGKKFASVKVSSSQLRNFFNDVKALEAKVDLVSSSREFEKIKPYVKLLKSKVAYAYKNGKGKIALPFKQFIDKCVDLVATKEDFKAFAIFFEAVVGFYYGEGGEKNR